MGIVVTEETVSVDQSFLDVSIDLTHNDGVDMSLDRNPTRTIVEGLHVFSLFRRRRLSSSEADGNPLIYALKDLKKYRIDEAQEALMWDAAERVFQEWACPWEPTGIMSIPSRHSVSSNLAEKIASWMGVKHISEAMICKKTVGEVLQEAEQLKEGGGVPERSLRAFKKQLGLLSASPPAKIFQMKEVKEVSVRHYFRPWKLTEGAKDALGHDILLVDDLVGSGASLYTCALCLTENEHSVVGAMSLFSPLDRELATSPARKSGKRRGRR